MFWSDLFSRLATSYVVISWRAQEAERGGAEKKKKKRKTTTRRKKEKEKKKTSHVGMTQRRVYFPTAPVTKNNDECKPWKKTAVEEVKYSSPPASGADEAKRTRAATEPLPLRLPLLFFPLPLMSPLLLALSTM